MAEGTEKIAARCRSRELEVALQRNEDLERRCAEVERENAHLVACHQVVGARLSAFEHRMESVARALARHEEDSYSLVA